MVLLLTALLVLNFTTKKAFDGFRIAPNVTSVYSGDSHVEECINDKLLPNSLNIAQNSECYYYTYFKVKKLLADAHIDTLYLGFSYHSLSDYYDDFVFGEYSPIIASKYFFILPNSEKVKFLKYNSENTSLFLRKIIERGVNREIVGGFTNVFANTAAIKKSMDKRIDFQFYRKGKLNSFSAFNMGWFDKIIQLCREKNVVPVLLNTPLHPYYKSRIPAEYLQKYDEVLRAYQLKVVDLNGLPLDDESFIPDGDHVSERGATIVSKYLASRMAGK